MLAKMISARYMTSAIFSQAIKRNDFKSDKEDYTSVPLYFCLILRRRGGEEKKKKKEKRRKKKTGWEKREAWTREKKKKKKCSRKQRWKKHVRSCKRRRGWWWQWGVWHSHSTPVSSLTETRLSSITSPICFHLQETELLYQHPSSSSSSSFSSFLFSTPNPYIQGPKTSTSRALFATGRPGQQHDSDTLTQLYTYNTYVKTTGQHVC